MFVLKAFYFELNGYYSFFCRSDTALGRLDSEVQSCKGSELACRRQGSKMHSCKVLTLDSCFLLPLTFEASVDKLLTSPPSFETSEDETSNFEYLISYIQNRRCKYEPKKLITQIKFSFILLIIN